MRKISNSIAIAFSETGVKSVGNTKTGGTKIWLHNNIIAEKRTDGLYITTCGWPTNTTKDRLNALPGVHIRQVDFQWILNGKAWNGEWITI